MRAPTSSSRSSIAPRRRSRRRWPSSGRSAAAPGPMIWRCGCGSGFTAATRHSRMSGTSAWPSIPRPASARRPMEGRSSCRPPPERPRENPPRPASDSGASVDIALPVFPAPRSCFRSRRRVFDSASHLPARAVARRRAAAPRILKLLGPVSCSSRSSPERRHAAFATLPPRGPAPRGGVRAVSNLSGGTGMSEPRFTTLTPETMNADQKRVADAIQSGPRGAGVRGPFNALLRSPELCDLVQRVGAYVRFGTSIPQRLNEMAIIMAGRKWTAQYEFYAHRQLALDAGLSPAIADAIAANQRPMSMAKDEETVYDFVSELLATGRVSDSTFQRVNDAFGERGVVDLVGAVGYYSLVSMTLNVAQVPLPAGVTPPLK